MRNRYRRILGVLMLLTLFLVWGFFAVGAGYFFLASESWGVRMAYYAVAGMGWVPIAMPIVSYMARRA